MSRMTKKLVGLGLALCLVLGTLAGCGGGKGGLSPEEAGKTLQAYLKKITVRTIEPRMDIGGTELSDPGAELPDIEKYPLSVTGRGAYDVEIMSSTEKAGPKMDGWLNEMAEAFNASGAMVNDGSASVSIRPVASGLATDYIVTGKYVPESFSPANTLWAEMIRSVGGKVDLVEESLAPNAAGILMSKKTHSAFVGKHGEVTLTNVLDAVMNGELLLGYTNPYVSSTGLNILTAMLSAFDPEDPLSTTAVQKLEAFQAMVPPVAYTTAQMRESAKNGVLDAMIMEYQAYINEPTLSDYVFTPFGVCHDNPVYLTQELSAEKQTVLRMFCDFCKSADGQAAAKRYGFGGVPEYAGRELSLNGAQLFAAQQVWKENKDGGRPVVAVFVTDTSGSMEGTPIQALKTSLLNAAQYIGEGNYIGLISYSGSVYINLPIGEFTGQQKAYFSGAVKDLSAGGGTATYDAVLVGLDMLLKKQEELPGAKLMLFVLSDGEQNEGFSLDQITDIVRGTGIPVHTIGYNANLSGLSQLSSFNEASTVNADESDVVYNLRNVFNAQM